jgi:hypothetical protein
LGVWVSREESKLTINGVEAYKDLHDDVLGMLDENESVGEVVGFLEESVRDFSQNEYGRTPRSGAFGNVRGKWNELIATGLLADIALERIERREEAVTILSLPSSRINKSKAGEIKKPKFLALFREEEFASGGLKKLDPLKGKVFLPSPDFIIATPSDIPSGTDIETALKNIQEDPSSTELFKALEGKLRAEDVKAAVSLKASNRPDGRYQPSFEAAMIKAISHLTGQPWKYFMVSTESTPSDRILFDNIAAPHEIASGRDKKLVDKHFEFSRKSDLEEMLEAALA